MELSALSGYARVLIRARRREIPCLRKRATMVARPTMWSRPFGATICGKLDRAAWGRSCGSAKLLAGTLRCLRLLLSAFEMLVARGTVGALPQTPQGALPLDPAKGSSTLWTPIRAIELASSPCFARVFILLALRLSPLPHDSIIPPRCQQIHQCINHRKHHIASNPDSIKQRVIMQSKCP